MASFQWFTELSTRERRTLYAGFGGYAVDAFDFMIYSFLIPTLIATWGMSKSEAGMIATSSLIWGIAAATGVSALLTASQTAYLVLRIVGAAYLVWFGATMLRGALLRRGAESEQAADEAQASSPEASAHPHDRPPACGREASSAPCRRGALVSASRCPRAGRRGVGR